MNDAVSIKIVIGGDVCPVRRNLQYFKGGDVDRIFNDLLVEFESADLSIVNLECPLIKKSTPIAKTGPVIGVESECIKGFKASKIDILNLANNHILDHGPQGLKNTLEVCAEAGISTVGAGKNIEVASKIMIKKVKGICVGILGVAEREFSIAKENRPGANPLNLINYVRNLKKHKGLFDYLIVLVHSGAGGYTLPSPQLMETCRFMVEMGANAVICQHSHCPGSFEKYKGSYIVYGQGNLIFDLGAKLDSSWNKGFLVKLTIGKAANYSMDIIPFTQSNEHIGAQKMSIDQEKLFLQELKDRSSKLSDSSYIQQQWINLCKERKDLYYFNLLFGFTNNKYLHFLHSKFPVARYFVAKKHQMLLYNLIRCETHREIFETIFEHEN